MSINRLRNICRLLVCTVLLYGCSADSGEPDQPDDGQDQGLITVVLRIPNADSVTRANPVGGEDGNGREQGLANENEVYDVNIFFYEGSGLNPINPNVKPLGVYIPDIGNASISDEENPNEKKITVKIIPTDEIKGSGILLSSGDVSFITVLNAGRDLSNEVRSLEDLRAFKGYGNSWHTSTGQDGKPVYGKFIMTTAYDADSDGTVVIDGVGRNVGAGRLRRDPSFSGEGPYWKGETTVQRICARIDLMHKDNLSSDNSELIYEVPGNGNTPNKVHITNVLPVNVMSQPTYLLSKVTEGVPASWTEAGLGVISWGGLEKTSGGVPSNYVIAPNTLLKESKVDATTLTTWYGSTRRDNIKNEITQTASGKIDSYFTYAKTETLNGNNYDRSTIICYANENIQSPNQFNSAFITGIALRAVYQPARLYMIAEGNPIYSDVSDEDWKNKTDKSFTRYRLTRKNDGSSDGITETDVLYFFRDEDAKAYAAMHPEDQAILTRFEEGVCYYVVWLRHYNDVNETVPADPHPHFNMEYAIVRNNIYRLALRFSGPGDTTPTMREPDTMHARIYVRKWNKRVESKPLEF